MPQALPEWLSPEDVGHLQRLMGSWGMLADLCFADLLLLVPTSEEDPSVFRIVGQMRPTTNPTLYREDMLGRTYEETDRPLVARSWQLGAIVEGEMQQVGAERARVQCIPVRHGGRMLAVLTRESAPTVGRRQGELEAVYVDTFDRFARMIVNGEFPFDTAEDSAAAEAPRVGDGVVLVDGRGRIEYASPNAVSALHRMGVHSNVAGARLDELGLEVTSTERALQTAMPVTEEVERRPDLIVVIRVIPLLEEGRPSGAVALMRDVTDLRRRDRLLISKDATIREVHHRVKNNLQTISSLLRLQGRRLGSDEGRTALQEAERRIRSIALVHEILSRDPGDQVAFGEIVRSLVHMAEDAAASFDRPVAIQVSGDPGEVPADVATPLAVVMAELLQNAVEHAFVDGSDPGAEARRVALDFANDGSELRVTVIDNGVGLPEGFDVARTTSLGLSLVRDLVTGQLQGEIGMAGTDGTRVSLRVPLPEPQKIG
ncbi:MAG TPA: histidine kinase N-terminal domain-containing protein [Acidimicrobiales bacterium]|nr:histidine kinase N-terminal domain-containing protein [Acidimicrobiales bacterium]